MGGVRNLSTATFTQIPNYKTSKKTTLANNTVSRRLDKTGEVERNYKMFANPVFKNPGRYIYQYFGRHGRPSVLKTLKKEGFVPLPHPRHSFFFLLLSQLEPREETLATQARKAVTSEILVNIYSRL